ncbi:MULTISPECIES: hemolysin family protein [Bacillota]|uniref:Hemolysin family protein n=2 Tax=Erysipelotrichaceae TaxID=128827 RepID=A0ABS9R8J3_9FIRM|nr:MULTISPECIES: hemolysin family protein [Bacillota]MCH4285991.1 hemolysin family protein [Amedibacillus hominis]RGB51399.1 HlyC/CorC family transporter [Absiella sp. AM22-9]RGB57856.1 HlyC/CorC family transporter [Absiella sp. AM10-20]RGB65646.1 HlyC/CorC family transporter [Absiella sp. AM09-45]RGB76035.1 HlyC/CorC family transporter [Absiella sp. AM09-50]
MDGSHIGLLILLVILIALSACFSSAETAYSSLNVIRLKQMAKSGNKKAKTAYANAKNFTAVITTILIGNNVVNILATSILTSLATELIKGAAGVAVATGVMTVLILAFGEITPKIVAKAKAENIALLMAKPLSILVTVLRPISFVVEKIEQHWEEKLQIENVTATEDELLEIVSTIEQEGVLEQEERELIESVIEFDDKNVRDIMVPRDQVVFLYDNATYDQLKTTLHDHKLSRLPVISYETTQVVGILRVRDVLDALLEGKEVVIKDLMQPPVFVTQRKKLPAVLEDIQKSREHIAIVEESQTSHVYVGIVTLEDVLEELVGEIYDEYDPLPNHVLEIGLHTFEIDGKVSLIDFFDTYVEDQDVPDTKARTFAAWIYELNNHRKVRKGREIEFENFEIKVLDTKDGMASRIELTILSYNDDEELLD